MSDSYKYKRKRKKSSNTAPKNPCDDTDYIMYLAEKEKKQLQRNAELLELAPYTYDTKAELYHLRNCSVLREEMATADKLQMKPKSVVPYTATICKRCYHKLSIVYGLEEEEKKRYLEYRDFFYQQNVPIGLIRTMTIYRRVKLLLINETTLRITTQEDVFELSFSKKAEKWDVFHNNYLFTKTDREMIPGFHMEDFSFDTLEDAMRYVKDYSFTYIHKREKTDAIEQVT